MPAPTDAQYDAAHVVADAVNALRRRIETGETPWLGYDGGPDTQAKYLAALSLAHADAIATLEAR